MKTCKLMLIIVTIFFSSVSCGDYQIVWSTIDAGGGTSTSEQYILTGTIGQSDAAYSAGENYELLGGFWPGGPSCFVEFDDFARFAASWLQEGSFLPADLDGNGIVNFDDLDLLVYKWLCACPYNWPLR